MWLKLTIRSRDEPWYFEETKEETRNVLALNSARGSVDRALFHRRNLLIKSRNLSRQRLMSTLYSAQHVRSRSLEHARIDYKTAGRSFSPAWWISLPVNTIFVARRSLSLFVTRFVCFGNVEQEVLLLVEGEKWAMLYARGL